MNHVREYSHSKFSQNGKQLIINNFSYTDSPFLFVATAGNYGSDLFGAGFFIAYSNSQFIFAAAATILLSLLLKLRLSLYWLLLVAFLYLIFKSRQSLLPVLSFMVFSRLEIIITLGDLILYLQALMIIWRNWDVPSFILSPILGWQLLLLWLCMA